MNGMAPASFDRQAIINGFLLVDGDEASAGIEFKNISIGVGTLNASRAPKLELKALMLLCVVVQWLAPFLDADTRNSAGIPLIPAHCDLQIRLRLQDQR
jgi:hypothetical protein